MRLLAALLLLSSVAVALIAEPPSNRLLTQPRIPTDTELNRIGLKRHWVTNVGTQGRRDGLRSLQVFDGQVVTQTLAGTVTALDAETGAQQWQVRPGSPFAAHQRSVGGNRHYFFVYTGDQVAGLERKTGQIEWRLDLPLPLACCPSADEANLYLCTSDNKIRAFFLPLSRQMKDAAEQAAYDAMLDKRGIRNDKFAGGQPREIWSFDLGSPLSEPPAAFGSHIILGDAGGRVATFENSKRVMSDRFGTGGGVVAPISQHGDMAYIASKDHHVYAVELMSGQLEPRWQFTAGSPIVQKPMVIGEDLYVVGQLDGLHRLDRASGNRVWTQPRAGQFLAATPRLVLAADAAKNLLVLDRQRGTLLGTWPARDYAFLAANDHSDRVYLGNHNGLVVCLRDQSPTCAKPQKYERPLSSAMESVARDFRKAKQEAEKMQAEEAAKDQKTAEGEGKPAPAEEKKEKDGNS